MKQRPGIEMTMNDKKRGKNMSENKRVKRVFLGGTCNGSLWRNDLIKMLKIEYFNPVVEHWTSECMAEEIRQRETCDYCLYVITPKMTSVFAIAEVVDDSNKRPEKTLMCILQKDDESEFDTLHMKHLMQVAKMVEKNGGHVFSTMEEVATFLNIK